MYLYSGPATKVELNTEDVWTGAQDDLGEAAGVKIAWEPSGYTLMDKSKTQNSGLGTFECRLAEAGSTNLAILKAIRNTRAWVRVTVGSGDTFTVKNVYLRYGYDVDLGNADNVFGYPLKAVKRTDDVEDFCDPPTDS